MDIRVSPEADKSMSLKNAWDMMQENSIVSLPIRDKDGELEGLVTIGDIAKTYMEVKQRPHYIVAESNRAEVTRIK